MRFRPVGATALHLLLLLASLLEASGQERPCCDEHGSPGADADLPIVGTKIDSDDGEHGDDCPCCGLCGPRILLSPSPTSEPTLVVVGVQAAERGAPFVKPRSAGQLGRGPPAGRITPSP
ncbi:MAG: DUF2946 family protein [Acidobacteriota bacterium]